MPVPFLFFLPKLLSIGPAILGFVLKYWKQCIVVGMALIIFHQNFMDTEFLKWVGVRTIPGIQYELTVAKEQLAACEESRTELKGAIEDANKNVQRWADVSKGLQRQHDVLSAQLLKLKQETDAAVQNILAEPTPQTCEAAIIYLRDAAQEELKWPGTQ